MYSVLLGLDATDMETAFAGAVVVGLVVVVVVGFVVVVVVVGLVVVVVVELVVTVAVGSVDGSAVSVTSDGYVTDSDKSVSCPLVDGYGLSIEKKLVV